MYLVIVAVHQIHQALGGSHIGVCLWAAKCAVEGQRRLVRRGEGLALEAVSTVGVCSVSVAGDQGDGRHGTTREP